MSGSFSAAGPYLDAASRELASLIAPADLAACRELLAGLPASAPDAFRFECPIAAPGQRTDFALSVPRRGPGMTAIVGGALPGGAAAGAWTSVRALFAHLMHTDAREPVPVTSVWLAFDLERAAAVPSVILADDRPGVSGLGAAGPIALHELLCRVAPLDVAMTIALHECHAAFDGAVLTRAGVLVARPGAPVALRFRHVQGNRLGWTLRRIAPLRPAPLPAPVIDLVTRHHAFEVDVELERGGGVGARIGITLGGSDDLIGRLERLGALLDRALVRRLRAWPGTTRYAGGAAAQIRSIDHVTLVCSDERIVEAKVHLGLRYLRNDAGFTPRPGDFLRPMPPYGPPD